MPQIVFCCGRKRLLRRTQKRIRARPSRLQAMQCRALRRHAPTTTRGPSGLSLGWTPAAWFVSGEDGIRTREGGISPLTGLANRRYRPLSHLSSLPSSGPRTERDSSTPPVKVTIPPSAPLVGWTSARRAPKFSYFRSIQRNYNRFIRWAPRGLCSSSGRDRGAAAARPWHGERPRCNFRRGLRRQQIGGFFLFA